MLTYIVGLFSRLFTGGAAAVASDTTAREPATVPVAPVNDSTVVEQVTPVSEPPVAPVSELAATDSTPVIDSTPSDSIPVTAPVAPVAPVPVSPPQKKTKKHSKKH